MKLKEFLEKLGKLQPATPRQILFDIEIEDKDKNKLDLPGGKGLELKEENSIESVALDFPMLLDWIVVDGRNIASDVGFTIILKREG